MTRFRVVGVTAILLAAVLVPAAPAHATVSTSYVGGVLTVSSDAASDVMVFTCETGSLRLNGAAIPGVAVCGVNELEVRGNGGDDTIDAAAVNNAGIDTFDLDGGDGNDNLAGAEATNPDNSVVTAAGGPGNDTMRFPSGDSVVGGDGDDTFAYVNNFHSTNLVLQGQGGTDTYRVDLTGLGALNLDLAPLAGGLAISTGPGAQVVPWNGIEAIDLVLTDGAETVRVGAFPGRARVEGRNGNDTLLGGDGADALLGGAGNDTLEGGDAVDSLDGGEGDDVVRARDEFGDTVACGAGSDVVVVDGADTTSGCETRDLGSGTDALKPKPKFSSAKLVGLKLQLKAKCPASELRCVGEAALSVTGQRRGATRTVKLGDVLVVADGGRKDRISLVLTRAQRAALSGLTKTKLKIAYNVMDAAGNVGKGTKKIPLKT